VLVAWIKKTKTIFAKDCAWKLISVIWLLIAFAGIHGNRLPFPMLMPHRWWAIFAIPLVILCAEGFFALGKLSERFKLHRFFVYAIILLGVLITSAYPKYVVETSYWPPGVSWGSMDEVQEYVTTLRPLPYDTKVFPICSKDSKILAFDKFSEPWDVEYARFKQDAFNKTAKQLSSWLRIRGYEYLLLDSYCARDHGLNQTNDKLVEIGNSTYFGLASGNKAVFLFKVL
jgi:hypothetical protein